MDVSAPVWLGFGWWSLSSAVHWLSAALARRPRWMSVARHVPTDFSVVAPMNGAADASPIYIAALAELARAGVEILICVADADDGAVALGGRVGFVQVPGRGVITRQRSATSGHAGRIGQGNGSATDRDQVPVRVGAVPARPVAGLIVQAIAGFHNGHRQQLGTGGPVQAREGLEFHLITAAVALIKGGTVRAGQLMR